MDVRKFKIQQGLRILEVAASRDAYPIPVLLVLSGRLALTKLPELNDCLNRDFWYGRPVNKGVDNPAEIVKGIQKAIQYCDIGVHHADSGGKWYPTISPREEDSLRRYVLSQEFIGVDLEWWMAKEVDAGTREQPKPDLTKVLLGRFPLPDGRGHSHWTFFKMDPASFAPSIQLPASTMHQKLRHVKVLHACKSRTRSMLVTQCVCSGRPIALDEFLASSPATIHADLPRIVSDVVDQLALLGTLSNDHLPVRDLLWKWHKRDTIAQAWQRCASAELKSRGTDPMAVFDRLRANQGRIWIKLRSCSHGDLHARNVAIDVHAHRKQAFIFDAAAMDAAVAVRDLAYLEVSSILFQSAEDGYSLVERCDFLFGDTFLLPEDLDLKGEPHRVQNTGRLVSEIRKRSETLGDHAIYALMVFDSALIELGGLAIQSSRNGSPHQPMRRCLHRWSPVGLSAFFHT